MNHPTSQLLQRHIDLFRDQQNLLVFGPPAHDSLAAIEPKQVITFDYRVYQSLLPALKERIVFGPPQNKANDVSASDACFAALVYIPKAKQELDLSLALVTSLLAQGSDLYLVGEKKAGIASAAKRLEKYGRKLVKVDSAKHCQLWHIRLEHPSSSFQLNQWCTEFSAVLNDESRSLYSLPGVFSHQELDDATALLIAHMPNYLKGRVLDFGCGCGVIGLSAALKNPGITLEMVDINWLALECARLNAEKLGIEVQIYPSDGWSEVKGRVDALLTNPPFHSGVATEYQTTESLIRQAPDHLSKHAPLVLVANNFLKYPPLIEKAFGSCRTLAENSKFRLYLAHR